MVFDKKKKILLCLVVLIIYLTGCVSMSQLQRAADTVDGTWAVANGNLLKTAGTRDYHVSKPEAFRAMFAALTELGFIVMNQDLETGIILAKAPIPTPLSKDEWRIVKEVEEPKMQVIVAPDIGGFYSSLCTLADKDFDVIINVIVLEKQENVQISLRPQMEYTGSTLGMVYGHQPPPEAVKYAINKTWDVFERALFIQKGTFK